ncbi:MAG: MFS transporter, partial [Actinobacteria bacterium]|nr:MFS transporter [Actinomycetota bacterium]
MADERRQDGATESSASPPSQDADERHPTTALGALREPLFRSLWIAALASNIGLWMTNVAAAWLMTDL